MSAAAKVLHRAIEDAVSQLEPQLFTLFSDTSTRRGAAEPAHLPERPTQRTHAALKMLVALTRFFPEEHRVRRAGQQLEMLWPPLAFEPRAAAENLLHYYFRLRQDLLDTPELALKRVMADAARAAIETAALAGNPANITACEQRLRCLAGFLPAGCVDMTRLETPGPLARLFLWQQILEGSATAALESDALSPMLLPDMLRVIDDCMALCQASDWSLDYFCNSGLARSLWQLRGMAYFTGNPGMVGLFEELDDECLDMHMGGTAPQEAVVHRWFVRLFGVVHARHVARQVHSDISIAQERPAGAIYDKELADYRRQLCAELHAMHGEPQGVSAGTAAQQKNFRVTAPLLTLLYKLAWIFVAAEQPDWARLCHCAYRLVLQFWRLRRPASATCHDVLCKLAHHAGTSMESAKLRIWRRELLQEWASWTGSTRRPIALRPGADQVVTLDAVPDLLSGSFSALVQAGRLTEHPSAAKCRQRFQVLLQDMASDLLQELMLLEHGAAAMKVRPLEQLCTLLISVHETRLRNKVALPVDLLQEAHRHLVRMLDQSAAWRETQLAPELVQALEAWLRASPGALSDGRQAAVTSLAADASDCEQALRAHLAACLDSLASVLERPVRLQLDARNVRLDAGQMMQVIDCLRPLIKFLLLDQSIDTRTRQALHKPRISTLVVTLRAAEGRLAITAGEDTQEAVLGAAELQRLQRRLPKAAGTLSCASHAGHGRAFTFTLG